MNPNDIRFKNVMIGLLCLFAIGFPIYAWFGTWCLLLMLVFWVATIKHWWRHFDVKFLNGALPIYFIFHTVGLIYTDNLTAGYDDVLSKLSLLITPLLISTVTLTQRQLNNIIKAFVIGTVAANLIYISYAIYQYGMIDSPDAMQIFTKIARPFKNHPAYISSYSIFGLVYIALYLFEHKDKRKLYRGIYILASLLLWFFVILYARRMQMITMCFVLAFVFVWKFGRMKKWLLMISSVIIFWTMTFYTANSFDHIKKRMETAMRNIESPGNIRFDLWESGWNVSQENMLVGVGTGDIEDELLKEYEKNDLELALKNKLNIHNQYLQSLASLGIFGLFSYLMVLFWPGYRALVSGNILILSFYLLFIFGTLTECMLETQRGAVWLAVLGSIFWGREKYCI